MTFLVKILRLACFLAFFSHFSLQQKDEDQESKSRAQYVALRLSNILWRAFKNATKMDLIQNALKKHVEPKLTFRPPINLKKSDKDNNAASFEQLLTDWANKVDTYLNDKVKALKNIVKAAETADLQYQFNESPPDEKCGMNYTDARDAPDNTTDFDEVNATAVALHFPIGIVPCTDSVQRSINLLSNENITRAFEENVRRDSTIVRQYAASTDTGILRIFPAQRWKRGINKTWADMTVDLFDARHRTWFSSAITCPKDVLFLVDSSGSVWGQTFHLTWLTIKYILTTLTPNDYINAVWYNKKSGLVLGSCFDGFLPATSINKMAVDGFLEKIEYVQEAQIDEALKFTYNEFSRWDNHTSLHSHLQLGSGCHKLLFVMTDSIEETGDQLYQQINDTNSLEIRFFGFSMGFNTPDIEALQTLSCKLNGHYSSVDSLEDVKEESREYIPIVSKPLALSSHEVPIDNRFVTWTGPYMDAQGEGELLTLSMPILRDYRNVTDDQFSAVAGIDIKLSALRRLGNPLRSLDSYIFAVDNNGHLLFHPRLRTPDVDLQMIRRTACSEAWPSNTRRESDKVIYWEATEEVKARMGLIDSIPNIDLAEVESEDPDLVAFRNIMVSGKCVESTEFNNSNVLQFTPRYAKKVQYFYYCRSLKNTPYSLGLAVKERRSQLATLVDSELKKDNFADFIVEYEQIASSILSPRAYCGAMLSSVAAANRWWALNATLAVNSTCPKEDNGATRRLQLDFYVVSEWLQSWHENAGNVTMVESLQNSSSILVFFQSDSGLTTFYPLSAQFDPMPFHKDVRESEYFKFAREWPGELNFMWNVEDTREVTAVTTINREESDYTLAIVGAQFPV